jgi:hypothetical protein
MKVVVLYRPDSEHARIVDDFIRDYKNRHEGGKIEILDIDSRDGNATATLYGIMQYPAILALRNDGSTLHMWEGAQLPMMDEVAYYTFNQE